MWLSHHILNVIYLVFSTLFHSTLKCNSSHKVLPSAKCHDCRWKTVLPQVCHQFMAYKQLWHLSKPRNDHCILFCCKFFILFLFLLFGKAEVLSICIHVHLNVCVIQKDTERKHIAIIFICKPLAASLTNAHSYKWTAFFTFCVSPEDCWKFNCTN